MDQLNPEVLKHTGIPPAVLEELEKDPAALTPTYRKMLAVGINNMHQLMRNPNVPVGQRMQFLDFLAKISDAYPKASASPVAAPGQGFQVNIIMSQQAKKPDALPVVEVIQPTNELIGNHADQKEEA